MSNWGNWYGSSGTSNKGSASAFFLTKVAVLGSFAHHMYP